MSAKMFWQKQLMAIGRLNRADLWSNISSQAGFTIVELVVAVPLLILLGMGLLNVFYTGSRHYREFLGDWELIQQVRVPMEELSRDIRYCGEMKITPVSSTAYVLYIRRHYLGAPDEAGDEYWQRYKFTCKGANNYWITKNDQPILGKTDLTDVVLEECSAKILGNEKVRIVIAGLNQSTGHRFRLDRTFYTYGYGLMPVDEEV